MTTFVIVAALLGWFVAGLLVARSLPDSNPPQLTSGDCPAGGLHALAQSADGSWLPHCLRCGGVVHGTLSVTIEADTSGWDAAIADIERHLPRNGQHG